MTESPHILPFAHYLALGFECPRIIHAHADAAESLVFAAYNLPDSGESPDWSAAESLPSPIPPELLSSAVIVCDNVIAHLPQPESLLAQIKRGWTRRKRC